MSESEMASLVRQRYGLRIEPHMSRYVIQKLASPPPELAIIGGDARTGIPVRQLLDLRLLLNNSAKV